MIPVGPPCVFGALVASVPDSAVNALYARVIRQLTGAPDDDEAPPDANGVADSLDASEAADAARLARRLRAQRGENGAHGATQSLSIADAIALWNALLAQRFVTAQEAALLMGLRMHGARGDLLAAFVRASRDHCISVPSRNEGGTTVVMTAFGTARHHPVMTPLLALRVAALGVPVVLITHDAGRGPNATALLHALRTPRCDDEEDVALQLSRRRFAWLPVEALSEPLARLIGRRGLLGFETVAHPVARLLAPVTGRARIVTAYADDAEREVLGAAIVALRLSALLVHGTDGDPVAVEGAVEPFHAWRDGDPVELPRIGESKAPPFPTVATVMPQADDIPNTARFYPEALEGTTRMPVPLERQAQLIAILARDDSWVPGERAATPRSGTAAGPLVQQPGAVRPVAGGAARPALAGKR
jgi:anthranilate phosphoribosyltransferase